MFDITGLTREAEARGLVCKNHEVRTVEDLANKFRFDTNLFGGYTSRDPAKLLALAFLIRDKYGDDDGRWEYVALLGQVAKREDLAKPFTAWTRHYVVQAHLAPKGTWLTLAEWLEENGHPFPSE